MSKYDKYNSIFITLILSAGGYLYNEINLVKSEQARQGQQIADISDNIDYLVEKESKKNVR